MPESMNASFADPHGWTIHAGMRRIQRREWWLWSSAVLITLLLTLGLISFLIPMLHTPALEIGDFRITPLVRGLVGLGLLFDVPAIPRIGADRKPPALHCKRSVFRVAAIEGYGAEIVHRRFRDGIFQSQLLEAVSSLQVENRSILRTRQTEDPDDAAITVTVINMARTLNLKVIAEGVETEQQMLFLRAHHCDEGQGYYFSRPLAAAAFAEKARYNGPWALVQMASHTSR